VEREEWLISWWVRVCLEIRWLIFLGEQNKTPWLYVCTSHTPTHTHTIMGCFNDTSHVLAVSGAAIATLAFLASLRRSTFTWFQYTYAALAAILVVAIAAINLPGSFPVSLTTTPIIELGVFLIYIAMAQQAMQLNMIGFTFLMLVPILQHNHAVVTEWLQSNVSTALSGWVTTLMFIVLVLLAFWLLWVSGLTSAVLSFLASVISATLLVIFIRMLHIEFHADPIADSDGNLSHTQICCIGSGDPPNRCPMDIGDGWNGLTLLLGFLLAAFSIVCWHYSPEEAKRQAIKKENALAQVKARRGSDGLGAPKRVHMDEWD